MQTTISDQQHLYIVLHTEHLIYSIAISVYELESSFSAVKVFTSTIECKVGVSTRCLP